MKPRFIDQKLIAVPHPGWQGIGSAIHPPCIVVISLLDEDGWPWIYTDDTGLHPIAIPEFSEPVPPKP